MKCTTAQQLISLEMDDRLSARDLVKLREHVQGCAACSAFAYDLRGLAAASSELRETLDAENFLLSVNPRIETGAGRQSLLERLRYAPRSLRMAGLAIGAACCVALIIGVRVQGIRRDRIERATVAETLRTVASQDIALSFGGPLDDLAVANLAALGAETVRQDDRSE